MLLSFIFINFSITDKSETAWRLYLTQHSPPPATHPRLFLLFMAFLFRHDFYLHLDEPYIILSKKVKSIKLTRRRRRLARKWQDFGGAFLWQTVCHAPPRVLGPTFLLLFWRPFCPSCLKTSSFPFWNDGFNANHFKWKAISSVKVKVKWFTWKFLAFCTTETWDNFMACNSWQNLQRHVLKNVFLLMFYYA